MYFKNFEDFLERVEDCRVDRIVENLKASKQQALAYVGLP